MLQELLITGPDGTIESDAEFPVLEQALKTGTHTRLILILVDHGLQVLEQIKNRITVLDHPLESKDLISLLWVM